jgi:hypothetical protein
VPHVAVPRSVLGNGIAFQTLADIGCTRQAPIKLPTPLKMGTQEVPMKMGTQEVPLKMGTQEVPLKMGTQEAPLPPPPPPPPKAEDGSV